MTERWTTGRRRLGLLLDSLHRRHATDDMVLLHRRGAVQTATYRQGAEVLETMEGDETLSYSPGDGL